MNFDPSPEGSDKSRRTVTSSDLVRQFGIWQELAAREPVYVLHRGRPRLVLASIDVMSALQTPESGEADLYQAREKTLLNTIFEPATIVDAELRIVELGQASRNFFGARAMVGTSFPELLPSNTSKFVADAIRRTIASGISETIEVGDGVDGRRRLEVVIVPHPAGALLVGRDRSVEDARDEALARSRAGAAALVELPGHALARIGMRGYLNDIDPSLHRLTGIPNETLVSVRFSSLFDVGSRVALGDAIEAVLSDGTPRCTTGRMFVSGKELINVNIALAATYRGSAISGVLAIIAATGQG